VERVKQSDCEEKKERKGQGKRERETERKRNTLKVG
jgi:hypothetical protein